ncbi:MAG: shikimate kinase [Hyphomonadaceae bacterium]|nr:shikimate kinase [Clostridia bacterium]
MQKNIVLIGMPAAGKSTVGVLLAKSMGMPFVDTDLVVQASTGRLLQEILQTDGVTAFLQKEQEIIGACTWTGTVIATGGSMVYSEKVMRNFCENSVVVYLRLDLPTILTRLTNISTRGIVVEKGQDMVQLYAQRQPLYERYAHVTIDCQDKNAEQIIAEIMQAC